MYGMCCKAFVLTFALLPLALAETFAQDTPYTPRHERPEGREVVAVYIGSATCGPCHLPENKAALEAMKRLLDERAQREGWSFSATGVALDWDPATGYAFLQDVGAFDEVLVGRSWSNLAAIEYIWSDQDTQPLMPQVVLFEREARTTPDGLTFGDRTVIGRYVADELVAWVDRGAPLD